jgi:hypothetical protein
MRFFLPAKYSRENAPKPLNPPSSTWHYFG